MIINTEDIQKLCPLKNKFTVKHGCYIRDKHTGSETKCKYFVDYSLFSDNSSSLLQVICSYKKTLLDKLDRLEEILDEKN